jgi:hypothetical protein
MGRIDFLFSNFVFVMCRHEGACLVQIPKALIKYKAFIIESTQPQRGGILITSAYPQDYPKAPEGRHQTNIVRKISAAPTGLSFNFINIRFY